MPTDREREKLVEEMLATFHGPHDRPVSAREAMSAALTVAEAAFARQEAELLDALSPFTVPGGDESMQAFHAIPDDGVVCSTKLTAGDFRRAREMMAKHTGKPVSMMHFRRPEDEPLRFLQSRIDELEQREAEVRRDEREACAKVAEDYAKHWPVDVFPKIDMRKPEDRELPPDSISARAAASQARIVCASIAAAIRTREDKS